MTEFFPENLRKILTAEQLEGGTATYSLVGFTGELGSGKDTAGEALTKIGHTRFAFGDALKRMLKHGLVQRAKDQDDRRKVRITLTEHGRALEKGLMSYAIDINRVAVAGIEPREIEICRSVLERISANLAAEFDSLPDKPAIEQ